LIETL